MAEHRRVYAIEEEVSLQRWREDLDDEAEAEEEEDRRRQDSVRAKRSLLKRRIAHGASQFPVNSHARLWWLLAVEEIPGPWIPWLEALREEAGFTDGSDSDSSDSYDSQTVPCG